MHDQDWCTTDMESQWHHAKLRDKIFFFSKIDLSNGYWHIQMEEDSKELWNAWRMLPVQDALQPSQLIGDIQSHDEEDVAPGQEHWTLCGRYPGSLSCMERTHSNPARADQQSQEGGFDHKPIQVLPRLYISGVCWPHIGEQPDSHGGRQIGWDQDAPATKTKEQVWSFLGLAEYYRKFLPNCAEVATPLTNLTEEEQSSKVIWEETQ